MLDMFQFLIGLDWY